MRERCGLWAESDAGICVDAAFPLNNSHLRHFRWFLFAPAPTWQRSTSGRHKCVKYQVEGFIWLRNNPEKSAA